MQPMNELNMYEYVTSIIIRIGRFIFDNIFNIPPVVCSNKAISYALAICWLRFFLLFIPMLYLKVVYICILHVNITIRLIQVTLKSQTHDEDFT